MFESLAREMCQSIAHAGIAELLLGGYCPFKNAVRAFRLWIDFSAFPIKVVAEEFWPAAEPVFLGSGAPAARALLLAEPHLTAYAIIKRVAEDTNVPSVGGALQVGYFQGREFHVTAIQDYSVDVSSKTVSVRILHRGMDLRHFMKALDAEDMNFAITFVQPFEKDLDRLIADGFLIRTP